MAVTRKKVSCVIFDAPSEMPDNQLPTYADVMKFYNLTKQKLKYELNNKDPPHHNVAEIVTTKVEQIWDKASIPHVSHRRVQEMLNKYHKTFMNLLKPYKSRKDSGPYREKISQFKNESKKLFDICSCKCSFISQCQCEKSRKIPAIERDFLEDQRGPRGMIIAKVDEAESIKLQKRYIRKELTQRQMCSKSDIDDISEKQSDVCEEFSSTEEKTDASDDESDDDCMPDPNEQFRKLSDKQMRVKLPSLALACDRHGVSDRAAAGIASAVLQDVGIIHERDVSKVIDRSKVRRERCKKRGTLCANVSNTITGLYFDGRKDSTITLIKECDGKFHRKLTTEEHISIISEPGSIYFGHITPIAGSSKVIAAELIAYLSKKNVDLGGIKAVGCDGTVANTGNRGGIIRLLEVALNKPLQWFVCQLHANELPLRHLFEHLDGPTNGPKGFSGPIGKSLVACEKLPVVKYTPINCVLPTGLNSDDLSTDQKYLFDLCTAVSVGVCPVGLSLRNPGVINHSRWLTRANRILRLYIATRCPSDELKTMVTFIVTVYAPAWFEIKNTSSCKDGARHVHNTILKSRYLTDELKKVVDPVIQRNAFFTHPENLLLAMLTDEKSEIRKLALRRIMKSRKQKRTSSVRSFCVPVINFEATSYIDMIDWQKTPITEPPIVMDIDDDTFLTMIREEDTPRLDFARYPCHTQSVERHVKLVTEASQAVCGPEKRDGFIRARLESRSKMPKLDTKAQHHL